MSSQTTAHDGAIRPQNDLLQRLREKHFTILQSSCDLVDGFAGQVLYHPGDPVGAVYFPCGSTLVSLALPVEEDREVEAVLVGREGAVGGIVSHGFVPAYCRIAVKIGGPLLRVSARKLQEAQRQSPQIQELFFRYADCLIAQILQSTACNAAHTVEQRAAKWIIKMIAHTGNHEVRLTHEQLGGLLGIGRTYVSLIIQQLKAQGIIEPRRGFFSVRNLGALQGRSCACNREVEKHFAEMFDVANGDDVQTKE